MLKRAFSKTFGSRGFCLFLHLVLLLLHISLVVIWKVKAEHKYVVPLESTGTASTIFNAASTVFITVFSAGLVVTTQRLALHKLLLSKQTLTASSDQSRAWTGVGGALITLWNQHEVPASVTGVLAIVIYLIGTSVLHTTFAATFKFEPFEQTYSKQVPTQPGFPNFSIDATAHNPFEFWSDTTPTLGYLKRAPPSLTIGYENATLYDVLPEGLNGTAPIQVNSTTFNVSCGALANATVDKEPFNLTDYEQLPDDDNVNNGLDLTEDPWGKWSITYSYAGGENQTINVPIRAPNSIAFYLPVLDNTAVTLNHSLPLSFIGLLTGPANLSDSFGGRGSKITIEDPRSLFRSQDLTNGSITSSIVSSDDNPDSYTTKDLTLFGCSLSLTSQSATVDIQSRRLLSGPPSLKDSSKWYTYFPDRFRMGDGSTGIYDYFVDVDPKLHGISQRVAGFYEMWAYMPPGHVPTVASPMCHKFSSSPTKSELNVCDKVSIAEEFVMNDLNLRPKLWVQQTNTPSPSTVYLHDLENSMAKISALMYWSAGRSSPFPWYQDTYATGFDFNYTIGLRNSQTNISFLESSAMVSETKSRLDINEAPLFVGLVISVCLLILAFLQTHNYQDNAEVSDASILSLAWLFSQKSEIRQPVSSVDRPSITNLRCAGMVEVTLAGPRLRRLEKLQEDHESAETLYETASLERKPYQYDPLLNRPNSR